MEFFIEKQLKNIVYSVILGLIFGVICDIIRVVRLFCSSASFEGGKVRNLSGFFPALFNHVTDLIFMIVVTALYSVFDYYAENSRFRMYLLIPTLLGFWFYFKSIGRIAEKLAFTSVSIVKKVILRTVLNPLRTAVSFVYKNTLGRFFRWIKSIIDRRRTLKKLKKLGRELKSLLD